MLLLPCIGHNCSLLLVDWKLSNMTQEKSETWGQSDSSKKVWAIIPAAGVGARMDAGKPKQYIQIGNQTLIEMTF